MSREHVQLLIAYFPTKETAQDAAKELKAWDKDYAEIELGAMAIMSSDDRGEIKTEKIGSRATGKGAKWGVLVGALAGILSGGIGLVGGAVAGLAVGSVAGTMVHSGLGISDEEKMNLQQHLAAGGVALAVMAHEQEAPAVDSILSALCDEVTSCQLDPETLEYLLSVSSEGDS